MAMEKNLSTQAQSVLLAPTQCDTINDVNFVIRKPYICVVIYVLSARKDAEKTSIHLGLFFFLNNIGTFYIFKQ